MTQSRWPAFGVGHWKKQHTSSLSHTWQQSHLSHFICVSAAQTHPCPCLTHEITPRYRERQQLLLSGLLVISLWTFPYGSTPLAAAHVLWYDRCQGSRLTSARLDHPSITWRRGAQTDAIFTSRLQWNGGCFLARRPSRLINGVFGTNRLQHQCKSL